MESNWILRPLKGTFCWRLARWVRCQSWNLSDPVVHLYVKPMDLPHRLNGSDLRIANCESMLICSAPVTLCCDAAPKKKWEFNNRRSHNTERSNEVKFIKEMQRLLFASKRGQFDPKPAAAIEVASFICSYDSGYSRVHGVTERKWRASTQWRVVHPPFVKRKKKIFNT